MPGQAGVVVPGQMGAAGNRFAHAQGALKGASSTVKMVQMGLLGLGVLLVIGSVICIFVVGIDAGFQHAGTGLGLAITGVVLVGTALLFLPQFTKMMGSVTSQVDAMAAKDQLAATGMPAMGKLITVQQTGRMVNYNPEVQALVAVQHPQMGAYQVHTTAIVPQMTIPQFQPGAQVQVRINPQNPQDIAVVV